MIHELAIETRGKGLHEITDQVAEAARQAGLDEGLCTVFIRHTSASLTIQENADPSVQRDLEAWMERQVPEGDDLYTHTAEGPDDMPAHIRAALTSTSLSIPIVGGQMALGTWQGIFVWEHRRRGRRRKIVVHVQNDRVIKNDPRSLRPGRARDFGGSIRSGASHPGSSARAPRTSHATTA